MKEVRTVSDGWNRASDGAGAIRIVVCPAFRQDGCTSRWRGQVTRWSFTTPTACRYA